MDPWNVIQDLLWSNGTHICGTNVIKMSYDTCKCDIHVIIMWYNILNENKKYQTLGKVPESKRKFVPRSKHDIYNEYIGAHFLGLIQTYVNNSVGWY